MLLSGLFSFNACSTVDHYKEHDSKLPIQIEPFVPDTNYRESLKLPEFGYASFEPEIFVIKYNRVAEVASLLGEGKASWYGPNFHGQLTASGERYDMRELTAAHPSLPFNTFVWVENRDNGRAVLVRINDRGPYATDRIIDFSRQAAKKLGMTGTGLAKVNLYLVNKDVEDKLSLKPDKNTYTIQLGIFKTGKKALAFADEIKDSRVEVVNENDKTYYGVFYGLYADRREAFKKQQKLQEQKNFFGFIKEVDIG